MQYRHSLPFGAELGPHGTRFRIWAPSANSVALVLQERSAPLPLSKEDDGWYEITVAEAGAGARYRYRIDDEIDVPDPASRFNPDGVHDASEVIDPAHFEWRDHSWQARPWHEAVVYELHIGTFTPEGTFAAIVPRLGELAELGINTLELMPVNAFSGERGWGYDGVLPYAPHPAYGRPDDLKRLVQAAHEHGLMVLLDVVYNHFGPDGNYLPRYAADFFTARHCTPWGNAINFEGAAGRNVRQFFIHNALYWINEYRFDGLRLDAVHAMLDDSDPHFIAELIDTVQRGPGSERPVHLVLENHHNQARYLTRPYRAGKGCVSQWNDDFHHPLHVLLTGETDGYYQDFAASPRQQLGRVLAEGFCFQGDVSRGGGNVRRGEPSADRPPPVFVNFLQTHDQVGNRAFGERLAALAPPDALRAAMSILLLAPQVPLLFMGEEYAARQPFLYFCDYAGELAAAVTEGRRKEFAQFKLFADAKMRERIPDPNDERTFARGILNWTERAQNPHDHWLQHVRRLLEIRRKEVVPIVPHIVGGRSSVEGPVLKTTWSLAQGGALKMSANLHDSPTHTAVDREDKLLFSSTGASGDVLQGWEIRLGRHDVSSAAT